MGFGFGPQFQPPPLSEDEVFAALQRLAARTGILYEDRSDWLIPLIIEHDASGGRVPFDRAARSHPSLPDTLTEKGLANLDEALAAIQMCAIFERSRRRATERPLEEGWRYHLSAVKDRRTCAAAIALHGQYFDAAPELPLPGCDALNCRCSLLRMSPSSQKRHPPPPVPGS